MNSLNRLQNIGPRKVYVDVNTRTFALWEVVEGSFFLGEYYVYICAT